METILNKHLYKLLADMPELIDLYEKAVVSNNWEHVEQRLKKLVLDDEHLKSTDPSVRGKKYYSPFHKVVTGKMITALKYHLPRKEIPKIEISFLEADAARKEMGFSSYKSPQDFLYGFTSERYQHWGCSLTEMGFRAACMSGVAVAEVWIIDDRYIQPALNTPDFETKELSGGIAQDFYETASALESNSIPHLIMNLCKDKNVVYEEMLDTLKSRTISHENKFQELQKLCAHGHSPTTTPLFKAQAKSILSEIDSGVNISSKLKQQSGVPQEQIGLKYCEEGKYLQKLFDGKRLEHFQSNVKMVKNPLRGNKVEADSIYRVLSEKTIIILEAKGKGSISKTQIYQLYETFKLKVPHDWEIIIVALFLTNATDTTIDLMQIEFDKDSFGNIGESLATMSTSKHFRWLIAQ